VRGGHDVAGVPPTAGRRDRRLRLLNGRDRLAAAPVRAVLLRAGHSGGPRGRGDCQPSRRLASSSRPATCCWCWESGECAWGAQTRVPSAPGCSWRPSTRCVDPTCWSSAGPLLDSAAPAAVVRFRYASVVVVRALVMSGTTIMDKPLPALRALMGHIQVCHQTTGLGSATRMRPRGRGLVCDSGQVTAGISLRLPSTEHGAARDGTERAGTTRDCGSCRPAICARHDRSLGSGGDATGLAGSWRCDL
jgi:hypothetical protein